MASKTEQFELAEKLRDSMYGPKCLTDEDEVWEDAMQWAEDILNGTAENPFEKKGE